MPTINRNLTGFSCMRTGTTYPVGDYLTGSPESIRQGRPANLRAIYGSLPALSRPSPERGLQRYRDRLPYVAFPSLGEGGTPLVPAPRLATRLGIGSLWVKMESQNPTGSHKDRLSSLVVARALDLGRPCVAAASSGNGGASLAAYAAAAGLRCAVVTTDSIPACWKKALTAYNAEIVLTKTSRQRWEIMAEKVEAGEWYPATNFTSPVVGSNLFGLQGYKTIAYEMAEDLRGGAPDALVIPVSRGDLLWGVYEGFRELVVEGVMARIPRLFAVEPFPRLTRVLAGDDDTGIFEGSTRLISIGGDTVAYQLVEGVRASGGGAVVVADDAAADDIGRLGCHGFYAEASSAVVFSAVASLRAAGTLGADDAVAVVLTSHGFKDGLRN